MDHFELFHLSLLQRQQLDIEGESYKDFTREQWLTKIFSEDFPFVSYGSEFYYLATEALNFPSILVGKLGRHLVREENSPPDQGLEKYTRDTWLASVVVIDPTHHEDGQKLAIQSVADIGKASTLIKNYIRAVNEKYPHGPYQIEISQIVETGSFWNFVEENKGRVTSVSFDFIAPNMLGADDEFYEEMRDYRDSEKARKIRLAIENPEGIDPETDKIKRAVNYALEGRGTVKARAKGNKRYNSEEKVRRVYIDDIKEKGMELAKVAGEFASRILGRE